MLKVLKRVRWDRVFACIAVFMLIWIVISYVDVAANNTVESHRYYFWNLFQLVFGAKA